MKLVKVDGYNLTISDEAYLVKDFRDLFRADNSQTKEKFISQMSIIFFLKDPRSTYNYIQDPEEKLQAILYQEGLPKTFKITSAMKKAMDTYEKLIETPSARLLKSAIIGAENLAESLEHIDFSVTDKDGKLVNLGAAKTLNDVPKIVQALQETQRRVEQEIEDQGRARGGNESKKAYEDGISFDD